MNKYILISIILLASCSAFKGKKKMKRIELDNYNEVTETDYINHFAGLEKFYVNNKDIKTVFLDIRQKKYLKKMTDQILKNNELFFDEDDRPIIKIISSETPFHFSLPHKKIFISSGLLKKYIKNEKILMCLLTYELIRSDKNLYRKNLIIPTGYLTTERMLSILRIGIKDKVEIHKWAFHIIKRVGIDTDNYLSWLQIQNRNSVDFSLQLGDISSVSREESLFKAFLIEKSKNKQKQRKRFEGSSKEFYSFVKKVKR